MKSSSFKNRKFIDEKFGKNKEYQLFFGLENPRVSEIEIGSGSALFISGWCFHPEYSIKKISVFLGSSVYRVNNFNLFRPDIFHNFREKGQIYHQSICSGFWCIIPLKNQIGEKISFRIEVTTKNNAVYRKELGTIQLLEKNKDSEDIDRNKKEIEQKIEKIRSKSQIPFVIICLATFNPDCELFTRQILSIKDQSYKNWICIINDDCSKNQQYQFIRQSVKDDPRFLVFRNGKNLGFYHNYEQLLKMVPGTCEYIALSDQDDYWYENKIERCVKAFDQETVLVYTDMRIVDRKGRVLSETFWRKRKNQCKDLEFLILANTITGASLMFRSRILSYLFPFPERIEYGFHDNWIGCVSLCCGKIRYLDIPLHDYYQHDRNIIGWFDLPGVQSNFLRNFRNLLNLDYLERILNMDLEFYNTYGAMKQALAICLALRMDFLNPDKTKSIKTFYNLDRSSTGFIFMMIKAKVKQYSTLGFEKKLFLGYWVARFLRTGLFNKRLLTIMMKNQQIMPNGSYLDDVSLPGGPYKYEFLLNNKLKPICLQISGNEKMRINFMMEIFDFKFFFGGFFANFNLMNLLYTSGYSVRLLLVEQASLDIDDCKKEIQKYEGLEDIFDKITIEFAHDRKQTIAISKHDVFVATNCWTAYLCHKAAKEASGNENGKFIFLIQEYEPFFHPHGSINAIVDDAYNLPHFAIFSTSFLKSFFKNNNIGVFIDKSGVEGEINSTSYNHPVLLNTKELPSKKRGEVKKFVFYARPEEHAKRNMFDLGMLAIIKALDLRILDPDEWEFYGIGTICKDTYFSLTNGITMKILPKMSLNEYYNVLSDFDLGLALMHTPHISLPPLDMAAAGIVVITTSCFGKTQESLGKISDNLIAVEPRLDCIVNGISQGVTRIRDSQNRIKNSNLDWPRSWDEAYDGEVKTKIIGFVKKIADAS